MNELLTSKEQIDLKLSQLSLMSVKFLLGIIAYSTASTDAIRYLVLFLFVAMLFNAVRTQSELNKLLDERADGADDLSVAVLKSARRKS